jgi:hypothetical protein
MELHHSVTGFFHDAVTRALEATRVEAAGATEFYLVNLLAEFTKASKVDEAPLAIKMAQASGASPEERVRALREIGDTSLYVSGFFADSLTRKLIDVDYYIAMGGSAYGQLSRGCAPEVLREAWGELSDKFRAYVDVLGEVRANTSLAGAGSGNVLRLCEEWVKTGSEWLEKRLLASGIVALDKTKTTH